ncbi:hypothetical protein ACQKIE_09795 [Luteibacter sp. NPDC031894]|jgi:hypothetical protein
MNAFDRYLADVGTAAAKRRPMSRSEWMSLIQGLGIPLIFLALLIAFCPR